jgi:hypothetical protein
MHRHIFSNYSLPGRFEWKNLCKFRLEINIENVIIIITEHVSCLTLADNNKISLFNQPASSIIWYNGTQLLAHGTHANSDDRISVTKSLGLEIKNVTVHDSGLYICKIFPSQLEIRATLVVDR